MRISGNVQSKIEREKIKEELFAKYAKNDLNQIVLVEMLVEFDRFRKICVSVSV